MSKIYITGHRNPDLDSVCASFAYAQLKNKTDRENEYIGIRCGHLSDTVKEQLATVELETVPYRRDVYPKVGDVMMTGSFTIQKSDPVFNLISTYDEDQPSAIPVFDGEVFFGLLSINDITRWFLKENTDAVPIYNFTEENIKKVLSAQVIKHGQKDFTASILAGAGAAEDFNKFIENDSQVVAVMGNRCDLLKLAIESQIPAIVITTTDKMPDVDISAYKGSIFLTKVGTAEAIRRLRMAVCTGELIRNQGPTLLVDTPFDEAKQILSDSRLRGLSVFDGDKWVGFVTRRCFLTKPSYNVILVDHNEVGQSIRGIETANVLEIIDHHRLDALKTTTPIYIDAEPVGSTCTIVYQQFIKKNVVPDCTTAKVLLVGIISDTLILKSPTTTQLDKSSAGALAALCGIFDIQSFGEKLFSCSQSLVKADPEKSIKSDFKEYSERGIKLGIGQYEVTTLSDLESYAQKYIDVLEQIKKAKGLDWAMLMITDVLTDNSILLVTEQKLNNKLPYNKLFDRVYDMPGVMSRKKQLLPEVLHTLD